jgi:hypothetical protein
VVIEQCSCGAQLLPELHFCVGCGARRAPTTAPSWPAPGYPPPATPRTPTRSSTPARSSTPWIVASASIVVVAVLAAVAVLTLRPALVMGTSVTRPIAAAAPTPAAPSPIAPLTPAPATFTPAPVTTSATDLLAEQVDRDRATVESITGQWVPQLSSKRPGTVANGITYDADTILSHYQGLAAAYPGAALLWSGDWPVFDHGDYWVVIVAQPFSTAAQANAWCDTQGFAADDCLAKKLTHTGGPQGTTVPRT